jgi:hypothetical protein
VKGSSVYPGPLLSSQSSWSQVWAPWRLIGTLGTPRLQERPTDVAFKGSLIKSHCATSSWYIGPLRSAHSVPCDWLTKVSRLILSFKENFECERQRPKQTKRGDQS